MVPKKIKKSQYEKLKTNYLTKNRSMHSLYSEIYQECGISRHLFFRLINKIRIEEGLNEFYNSKHKKNKKSCITYMDKAPHSYSN